LFISLVDKGQIWRRHTEQLKATKMEQTREAPNVDDCIVVHDGDEQSTIFHARSDYCLI
jgi:hypothetical protein